MADTQTLVLGVLIVAIAVGVLYLVDPSLGGALPALKRAVGLEGFKNHDNEEENKKTPGANPTNGQASAGTGPSLAAAVKGAASAMGGNSTSGLPSTVVLRLVTLCWQVFQLLHQFLLVVLHLLLRFLLQKAS
jgi:hypothetical protein